MKKIGNLIISVLGLCIFICLFSCSNGSSTKFERAITTSITIYKIPTKTIYKVGEEADFDGLAIARWAKKPSDSEPKIYGTIFYKNELESINSSFSFEGFDSSKSFENQIITVFYETSEYINGRYEDVKFSTTFNIQITDILDITKIELNTFRTLYVEWNGIPNANEYKIEVYSENEELIGAVTTSKTNYTFEDFANGTYKFRVGTLEKWGAKKEFTVDQTKCNFSIQTVRTEDGDYKVIWPDNYRIGATEDNPGYKPAGNYYIRCTDQLTGLVFSGPVSENFCIIRNLAYRTTYPLVLNVYYQTGSDLISLGYTNIVGKGYYYNRPSVSAVSNGCQITLYYSCTKTPNKYYIIVKDSKGNLLERMEKPGSSSSTTFTSLTVNKKFNFYVIAYYDENVSTSNLRDSYTMQYGLSQEGYASAQTF